MLARVTVAQSPTSDELTIRYASILPTPNPQPARAVSNAPKRPINENPRGYSGRHYSKEEVIELIRYYAAQSGILPEVPLKIASCESGYNQFSKNKNSTASGVYQYLSSTWKGTEAGKQGISVFDADANVHMAIKSIASGGINNWSASKSCWNHG